MQISDQALLRNQAYIDGRWCDADIGETTDLAAERPGEVQRLRALLRRQLDACGAQFPTRSDGSDVLRP